MPKSTEAQRRGPAAPSWSNEAEPRAGAAPARAPRLGPGLAKRGLSQPSAAEAPRFRLAELAGRLVELSADGAPATLTFAMSLVLDAQREGEPVAWVGGDASSFYPPDAAESGVDLEALVVVRVPASKPSPARPLATWLATAAERLLRSGAFGLVVLDLSRDAALGQSLQSRLLGLAQRHHAAVVCLTHKPASAPSLGSLVSLRAQAIRTWLGRDRFACELHVLKDKRRGPVWSEREVYRGPLGLR